MLLTNRDARFDANDPPDPADRRTVGQRDRDRIIYTTAFRRLAGVTQVVAAAERHVFHNRLTHTIEVAQIARRIAERVLATQGQGVAEAVDGVDPDVVEAAALAHDLGHPPFGHIAEQELDDLVVHQARILGGFEGNPQSFRIITKLAIRHRSINGLNLSRATLNAVSKYPWARTLNGPKNRKWGAYQSEEEHLAWARQPHPHDERKTAEAEIMDWADDIAYCLHDVEDFYRGGLIPLDRLKLSDAEASRFFDDVWGRWNRRAEKPPHGKGHYEDLVRKIRELIPVIEPYSGSREQSAQLHTFKSRLIGGYIAALSLHVPQTEQERRVTIADGAVQQVAMLKELTWVYVINNPSLATQQYGQRHVVRRLFEIFSEAIDDEKKWFIFPLSYLEQLREISRSDLDGDGRHEEMTRVVVDLIAGMTEQQAIDMYARLSGTSFGSVLEHIVR